MRAKCVPNLPPVLNALAAGALDRAACVLAEGRVVCFPTETVYGLAVRAGDGAARRRLARVKRRPERKPFQVLVASRRRALEMFGPFPKTARRLARAFWPGPLTLVIKGRGGRWVGIRVPDHRVAQQLIRRAGGAVAATSANISGEPPAQDAASAARALGNRVDLVLDGGPAAAGAATTVVRVEEGRWTLLREGAIRREMIAEALEGRSLVRRKIR